MITWNSSLRNYIAPQLKNYSHYSIIFSYFHLLQTAINLNANFILFYWSAKTSNSPSNQNYVVYFPYHRLPEPVALILMYESARVIPIPQNGVSIVKPAILSLRFWLAYIAVHGYYCFISHIADPFSSYTAVAIVQLYSNWRASLLRSPVAIPIEPRSVRKIVRYLLLRHFLRNQNFINYSFIIKNSSIHSITWNYSLKSYFLSVSPTCRDLLF
jgi:hypothetical protein